MKISVCIGSSCHLRGSYDIIQRLKELVARDHLEDQVELSAAPKRALGRDAMPGRAAG